MDWIWIYFGLALDSIWSLFWSRFGFESGHHLHVFRLSDEFLVLDSFWTWFGVRYGFGSNLDLDWRGLAPSLSDNVSMGNLAIKRNNNVELIKHDKTVYNCRIIYSNDKTDTKITAIREYL